MKTLFLLSILALIVVQPVFSQSLSDKTGLTQRFTIETGGYEFEVTATSNYDVSDVKFSSEEKLLTFFISSGVRENISEIIIPKNLINGNFTFFLNDQEITANVRGNENISFITVEFPGNGTHKLDIIGTTYLPEFSEIAPLVLATSLFGIIFLLRSKKLRKIK